MVLERKTLEQYVVEDLQALGGAFPGTALHMIFRAFDMAPRNLDLVVTMPDLAREMYGPGSPLPQAVKYVFGEVLGSRMTVEQAQQELVQYALAYEQILKEKHNLEKPKGRPGMVIFDPRAGR